MLDSTSKSINLEDGDLGLVDKVVTVTLDRMQRRVDSLIALVAELEKTATTKT